ncbi:MAG: hypothetical protein ACREBV_09015 [Candidatus Zixiibacteriota bacterium]
MCTSKKQIKANRQNAQKSTGPVTLEGKHNSSQNGTIHGLNSVKIIISSPKVKEDQSEYDLLVAALTDEHQPRSTLEQHLVYKIANCHWRYRRLINAETAYINKQSTPYEPLFESSSEIGRILDKRKLTEQSDENWGLSRLIPLGDTSHIISRYEWRLSRELYHSYRLLRQIQSDRIRQETQNRRDIKKQQSEPISVKSHTPQEHIPDYSATDFSHPPNSRKNPTFPIPFNSPNG